MDVLFGLRDDVFVVALSVTEVCRRVGDAAGRGVELGDWGGIEAHDDLFVHAFTALCCAYI